MKSIWSKTCNIESHPSLNKDIEADVAVIGGGMAGILAAYELEQSGVHTVLLEADRIGGGQTKNTTAKITSQHGMFCHTFIKNKGKETAKLYVQANQNAIEEYRRIIEKEQIRCDLSVKDSYVYSRDEEKLKKETEAAQKLGIDASFEKQIEIPVLCAGAVRFPGQAEFHPLKFIEGLAGKLNIYENTPVKEVRENRIRTACGTVLAGKIIFAVHFPFVNFPGMYFTRMHQECSYVLALERAGTLNGMYIGEGEDKLSFRQYDGYILLGGEGHRAGENREGGRYAKLQKQAEILYPDCRVAAYWSAQDCVTADNVPFIGRYAPDRPDWLVASGFQKWGMSSSMTAALLLKDLACGIENPYATVFDPSRFSAEEIPQIMRDTGKAVKGLTKRFFYIPDETTAALERGQGSIVETSRGKAGVYKTEEGEIFQVEIVCPHLGCELSWNPDEKTWDCPCHGSRFDYKGKLLEGPAQEGIESSQADESAER